MAFLGSNGRFMGVDEEGDIVCKSKVAGPAEFVQVCVDVCHSRYDTRSIVHGGE